MERLTERLISIITIIIIWLSVFAASSAPTAFAAQRERLRVINDFKTPEEVVAYYCGRDSAGFIWSGLSEAERVAFTLWNGIPQSDSFLIAKKYQISALRQTEPSPPDNPEQATVQVRYELIGLADAHGTLMPPPQFELMVNFILKKANGGWKIATPEPSNILPVILESHLPRRQSPFKTSQ